MPSEYREIPIDKEAFELLTQVTIEYDPTVTK